MHDKVQIRLLTIEDLDHFFTTFSELLGNQFPEYSEKSKEFMLSRAWSKERYGGMLTAGTRLLYGAFNQERLVGILDAEYPFAGVSLCIWLMVAPEYQHQHIGKALLQVWEEKVKELGGHNLYLYADPRNKGFYEKMEFTCIGMHAKGWFGLDEYVFSKIIQEPKEEHFLK